MSVGTTRVFLNGNFIYVCIYIIKKEEDWLACKLQPLVWIAFSSSGYQMNMFSNQDIPQKLLMYKSSEIWFRVTISLQLFWRIYTPWIVLCRTYLPFYGYNMHKNGESCILNTQEIEHHE